MEPRNREARRGGGVGGGAASALRRPRANGPKDASDEDERMDDPSDSKLWERPKKERIGPFHLSVPANSRNKRKRQVLQDLQAQGRSSACDDAEESAEETGIPVSEDDDEPPPPPPHRRPGKSRGTGRVKGDELVMDIRTVPRKARSLISSSSRFSSNVRRPQECLPADASRQQSPLPPQTSLNGVSASSLLGGKPGRRMKSNGTKIKAMKVPKVTEPTTISDQEVEVAEVLFDLARSMPSRAGLLESKLEQKVDTNSEAEVCGTASPPLIPARSPPLATLGPVSLVLQTPGSSGDIHAPGPVQNVVVPAAEAPKRKRPRYADRQEEGRAVTSSKMVAPNGGSYSSSPVGVIHSPVGEAEQVSVSEKSQIVVDEGPNLQPESLKAKVSADSPLPVTELHGNEDAQICGTEHRNNFEIAARNLEEKQDNVNISEIKSGRSDSVASSPVPSKVDASANISVKNDGAAKSELLSRPIELFHNIDGDSPRLGIGVMPPPLKVSIKEEGAHDLVGKLGSQEDSSINVRRYPAEVAPYVRAEQLSEGHKDIEDVGVGVKKAEEEHGKANDQAGVLNQEPKKEHEEQMSSKQLKEGMPCQVKRDGTEDLDVEMEKDSAWIPAAKIQKSDSGTPSVPSYLPSTFSTDVSSTTPVALAGWMGPLGYYGSGAPAWPASASLPRSNLDGKTSHPVMQLPHAAFLPPVPRMKRCTTHVYIAHYIYFEQQRSRHALWPATICRGAPYNLNIPPMNIDKGKICGSYVDLGRKVATQQPGPAYGYTVAQSTGPGIAANSVSLGNSTTGNTMSASCHSTVSGIPVETGAGTTSGSVVNVAAHAQYLQAMMQPNGFAPFSFPFNGPPGQAAQYFNNPFYPAHLVPPLPHLQSIAQQASNLLPVPKQQQGSRTSPNSSSSQLLSPQQQQQLQLQLAPQSPSHSQHHQQQHSMGISTQHFGTHADKDTVGGESHSTAESRLPSMQRRGKQSGKSQQQTHIQVQQPPSVSPSMQQHQQQQVISQNSGPGSGIKMKVPDLSASQAFASMNVPTMNRGSVGPGPLGLVPVAAVMAAQGHPLLSGSPESTKMHAQQHQSYGIHNQQYHQRTMPAVAASVSEDAFVPGSNNVRDLAEDKQSVARQSGCPSNLSRADIEVSSPSVRASSSGGSVAPAARLANNVGRTFNVATGTGTRNCRSAPGVGTGQVAQLQNQTLKQGMPRPKTLSGTSIQTASASSTIPLYVERAGSHPGNLGKIPASVLPLPAQMASCSQASKQGQSGTVRGGQRISQGLGLSTSAGVLPQVVLTSAISKSPVQQARDNQQGTAISATPGRVAPSVSAPVLSSGTLSLCSSHSLPVLKNGVAVSKSPSNGKGTAPVAKSVSGSVKRPPVSGPAISSVSPGQNMSAKSSFQQKNQGHLPPPHFSPQQSTIQGQQQQAGTKQQICHQQQPQQVSSPKQSFPGQSQYRLLNQQYLQNSQVQQQVFPQQTQQASSQFFQQHLHNSPIQHGHSQQPHLHLQQQLQSVPCSSSATTINALSLSPPNLTLGTGLPATTGSTTSSDGADEFRGSGPRANPKTACSPGNQLPGAGPQTNTMALLSATAVVSGQQHSDSSHYLQLAPVLGVKSKEQKSTSDGVNWEERNSIRPLPSSSPSQPPLIANPSSS